MGIGIGIGISGVRLAGGGGGGIPVLLDLDLSSDVDDAGDLAVANYLMERGLIHIIGVGICVTNTYSPGAADAINTYYGNNAIPIGANKGAAFDPNGPGSYAQHLAENFDNDIETATNAEEIVDMYRRILSARADGSVVMISTGPLNTLSDLLASSADGYSALSGSDLVAAKVRELICVAGRWPTSAVEWNVQQDITSANDVAVNWPTTITWIGMEMGDTVKAGNGISDNTPVASPVRKAYELTSFNVNGREAWSLFGMMYAAYGVTIGEQTVFGRVRGTGAINASTGATTWTSSESGPHYYLYKTLFDSEYQDVFNEWLFWDAGESVPVVDFSAIVSDEFTDTDSTALDAHTIAPTNTTSTTWTEQVGDWSISGNAATVAATAGGDNFAFFEASEADVIVEAQIVAAASGIINIGVIVNYQDATNYWLVQIYRNATGTNNLLQIYEQVGGTYTERAVAASVGIVNGNTYTLLCRTNGNTIEARLVETNKSVSYTPANRPLKTATKCGVRIFKKTPPDAGTDNGSKVLSIKARAL